MDGKHFSISSLADVEKIDPCVRVVHFRKYMSRRILNKVLARCSKLEKVSVSRSVFLNCDNSLLEKLSDMGLDINVSKRNAGRPNLLEMF